MVDERPLPAPPAWFASFSDLLPRLADTDLSRFAPPPGGASRASAVLILLGDGEHGPDVLLTERSATMRSHPGQVSFPGGAVDPGDDGPAGAAVREAQEETGLDPAGVHVAGLMPVLYLPVSDFAVTPVLAWWREPGPVHAVSEAEVARVARVPLAELVEPAHRFQVAHPSGFVGPGFAVRGLFVWGFTAGLLSRLLALAGWERPWDTARRVEIGAGDLPVAPSAFSEATSGPDAGASGAGSPGTTSVAAPHGAPTSGRSDA